MNENYVDYFSIDEEFKPVMNEEQMEKEPDLWTRFYPHKTFVNLLRDVIKVLTREKKLGLWVEGAYGTGKSYAVLTLKRMLESNADDIKFYFKKYEKHLSNDLLQQFLEAKSGEILTVHRAGSSDINSDAEFAVAVQESIEKALKEKGLVFENKLSLKNAAIKWLKGDFGKNVIDNSSDYFQGDNASKILEKLETNTGSSLQSLMNKLLRFGKENGISVLKLEISDLKEWIKSVIQELNLKSLVFIWDEFTEYFKNNLRSLTGFQEFVQLCETVPFCFIIVTHNVQNILSETDKDQQKILDRFVSPTCKIELPDGMAFELIGDAMKKTENVALKQKWQTGLLPALCAKTKESRALVQAKSQDAYGKITDEQLKGILPLHPYSALFLKHVSSQFSSNQRSMFDFIISSEDEDAKGFKWYIKNYGPSSSHSLLTVDMIWSFFYEKGKDRLDSQIKSILDYYERVKSTLKNEDEKSVVKAVLLMQAISSFSGGAIQFFAPTKNNLNTAFEGTPLGYGGQAGITATSLCQNSTLYKKDIEYTENGKRINDVLFQASIEMPDDAKINAEKENVKNSTTTELLIQTDAFAEKFALQDEALKLRYELKLVSKSSIKSGAVRCANFAADRKAEAKIYALVAIAKDDGEGAEVSKIIDELKKDGKYKDIVFIDATKIPFGQKGFDAYINFKAQANYYSRKNGTQSNQDAENANAELKKWAENITRNEFYVYCTEDGGVKERKPFGLENLFEVLREIDKKRFPMSIESSSRLIVTMWQGSQFKNGAKLAASRETSGLFNSARDFIGYEVWNERTGTIPPYWEKDSQLYISKIKCEADKIINEAFTKDGKIAIRDIYEHFRDEPFGFMPCNITAFVLGFVLKEYATGQFRYSDSSVTCPLTPEKLGDILSNAKNALQQNDPRYRNEYIVMRDENEKAFDDAVATVFDISSDSIVDTETARKRMRNSMNNLPFPLWCLKYLDESVFEGFSSKIEKLIDLFMEIANNTNETAERSDTKIAQEIGSICLENDEVPKKLHALMTKENITSGMKKYLEIFENGELPSIAKKVGAEESYINVLRNKMDGTQTAANWLWKQETVHDLINDVITEYKIVLESGEAIPKENSFNDTILGWKNATSYIRLSLDAVRSSTSSLSNELLSFLDVLLKLKRSGEIKDKDEKQHFLEKLTVAKNQFAEFYSNQAEVFEEVASFYLEKKNFSKSEIKEICESIPKDCFEKSRGEYFGIAETKIKDFEEKKGSTKLKKLWEEKTKSSSPSEWSNNHKMPILCVISQKNFAKAKDAFDTINAISWNKAVDADSIKSATDYLDSADANEFLEVLNDQDALNKKFKETIIKDCDILLEDVDDVKNELSRLVSLPPYDWFLQVDVEIAINKIADANYKRFGSDKAMAKIDNMDATTAKNYLKQLIANNMIVGIQILKDRS